MFSASNQDANLTAGRPQMAAIRPNRQTCELASRESNGIAVTLLWNRRTDALRVCVSDARWGAYFELDAERDNALDVFHHPYAYAPRGVPYDEPPDASPNTTEQPSRMAA
jgi:hypothetical protein